MKLSVMREYVHLCGTKNYSKTAKELYIDQSALSRHIVALEKEMGAQLIERTKNSFQLTEAGKLVEAQFKKILEEYQTTIYGISALIQKQEGELKLGVLYYDINGYVAAIRAAFHKAYPKVKLKLYSYQPEELESKLLNGEIDAGILYSLSETDNKAVEYMNFLKIPIQVIFSNGHRLSQKEQIFVEDLNGEKILWPDGRLKLCRTDLYIERFFSESNVIFGEKITLTNYDEVPYLLEDTGAIYISPMFNSTAYGDSVETRYIEPDRLSQNIGVAWLKKNNNEAISFLCNAVKICYP